MPFANDEERRAYHKNYYEQNKARGWNKHLKNEPAEKREIRLKAMREYMMKRQFGISSEQYEKMLLGQDGKCAICKRPPTSKAGRHDKVASLAIDHCHTTGRVRRLLCGSCNLKLGWYEKNAEVINSYLQVA